MLLLAVAAALTFTTPAGWQAGQPSSSMRVAELTLPRAAGDPEDAQLVVYYFGGQGGSVQANIDRWVGQMQQADGKPSVAASRSVKRQVNGLALTLVDVSGTYIAEVSPGANERNNKPQFRLRAGVVQTANGPYYIKLTGPEKTVAKWDQAFEQFVGSLKFK